MMLLLRSGDRAIISDAAAKPTAIIAVVAGSMMMPWLCSRTNTENLKEKFAKQNWEKYVGSWTL